MATTSEGLDLEAIEQTLRPDVYGDLGDATLLGSGDDRALATVLYRALRAVRQRIAEMEGDYARLDRIANEQEDTITMQAKRIAAMEADKARLDRLESVVHDERRCVSLHGNPPAGAQSDYQWTVHRNGIGYGPWGDTARAAIDAITPTPAAREGE